MKNLLVLSLVVLVSACANSEHELRELSPEPNVALVTSPTSLMIAFDANVAEAMPVAIVGLSRNDFTLEHWHETLSRGFHNGFDRFFAAPTSAPTNTLVILATSPTLIWVRGGVSLMLRYQAELRAPTGEILKRFAGTALVPEMGWSLEKLISRGVEIMYEQIAQQMNH